MRWLERRRAGLTVLQLLPTVREVVAAAYEGEDLRDPEVRKRLAIDVADAKLSEWPADVPKLDWEKLLAIIIELLPLILQIIALF